MFERIAPRIRCGVDPKRFGDDERVSAWTCLEQHRDMAEISFIELVERGMKIIR